METLTLKDIQRQKETLASDSIRRGGKHLIQGDYTKASRYFKKGLNRLKEESPERSYLTDMMGNLYLLKGEYQKSADTCGAEIDRLDRDSTSGEFARLCRTLGAACLHLNDQEAAEKYLTIALDIFRRRSDRSNEALTLFNLGMLHQSRFEYKKAENVYEKSLGLFKENGDYLNVASILMNLGILYQERVEYDFALKKYQECLRIAKKIQNLPLLAKVANNTGNLFLALGNYKEAEELILYSLRLSRELKIDYLIGYNRLLLGSLMLKRGDSLKSIEHYSKALKNFESTESKREICLTQIHLANSYCESQNKEQAEKSLNEACALAKKINSKELSMQAILVKAKLQRLHGHGKSVLGMLKKAKAYFSQSQRNEMLWETSYEMGEIYDAHGEKETAHQLWKEAASRIHQTLHKIPKPYRKSYLKDKDREKAYAHFDFAEETPPDVEKPCIKIIGRHPAILDVIRSIEVVSRSSIPVVIQGDTGTGKELVAQSIHYLGDRRDQPFVIIDCAALSSSLIESELFGHEEGAFTGAHKKRIGKLELANNGTLFLDEVDSMPLHIQGMLLRFLQEKEFMRLGGNERIRVNTRIISASKKDLEREVNEGRFREDLFYRLDAYLIKIPPLRERKEDIPLLVEQFLQELRSSMGHERALSIEPEALILLTRYDFPGNVRELKNEIVRASTLAGAGNVIQKEMLSDKIRKLPRPTARTVESPTDSFVDMMEKVEKDIVLNALMTRNGNITKAAEDLGLSRYGLYKKMRRLGIQSYKEAPATS